MALFRVPDCTSKPAIVLDFFLEKSRSYARDLLSPDPAAAGLLSAPAVSPLSSLSSRGRFETVSLLLLTPSSCMKSAHAEDVGGAAAAAASGSPRRRRPRPRLFIMVVTNEAEIGTSEPSERSLASLSRSVRVPNPGAMISVERRLRGGIAKFVATSLQTRLLHARFLVPKSGSISTYSIFSACSIVIGGANPSSFVGIAFLTI
jgi:hypothetical protein